MESFGPREMLLCMSVGFVHFLFIVLTFEDEEWALTSHFLFLEVSNGVESLLVTSMVSSSLDSDSSGPEVRSKVVLEEGRVEDLVLDAIVEYSLLIYLFIFFKTNKYKTTIE